MIRKIIHIDTEKCSGCGACADACHEGAIAMVDGKARLMRDDYCDGFGDCLPACPTGAIRFAEREAAPYDEQAVQQARQRKAEAAAPAKPAVCPGKMARSIDRTFSGCLGSRAQRVEHGLSAAEPELPQDAAPVSQLSQWPVQIKLVPINAPYFEGAKLLIAADCTAYAYANFHRRFIRGHITLVGCPKLDAVDYSEKLTEIIRQNNIQGVTVVRMEVPCCGGLERAAKNALQNSGKFIPWQVVTISIDGKVLDRRGKNRERAENDTIIKTNTKEEHSMEQRIKNIEKSQVLALKEQVAYQPGQVVSKTLAQNAALSITLFAFDKGEEISTHESDGDALVTCLDGVGRVTVDGTPYELHEGGSIVMPARHPHAVYGQEQFKMLLVVVF